MIKNQFATSQSKKQSNNFNITSPMCPKRPVKNPTLLVRLSSAHARLGAILLILTLATLAGGLWLNAQVEKNKETLTVYGAELPEPLFTLKLITSRTNSYTYPLAKYLLENLPKIGIGVSIGHSYPGAGSVSNMVKDSVGYRFPWGYYIDYYIDLTVMRWPHDPFGKWSFSKYYHSPVEGYYGYPINLTNLDTTLENMDAASTPEERRNFLLQSLGMILWDTHAITSIGDVYDPFGLNADVENFDADRWSYGLPNLPEMYYASSGRTTFAFGSPNNIWDLNPVFAYDYDPFGFSRDNDYVSPHTAPDYVSNLVFSKLVDYDTNLTMKPLLAANFPVPIGSNDSVPFTGITEDSPYYSKEGTAWGPNPTINASQHNPIVTTSDNSMFLVRLRDGIPWQPGYGYTAQMKLNVTADDLIWTFSYFLSEELSNPHLSSWRELYGTNHTKAIEKINATTVKINFRGPFGNGKVTDWLEALSISPLPRHILDPTFNSSPYRGGGIPDQWAIGWTPDGTFILPYAQQRHYRYNTGKGDTPLVACGPYYVESVDAESIYHQTFTLKKFADWGGRGNASLWNEDQYKNNNIGTYTYTHYSYIDNAIQALQNGLADGVELANLDYKSRDTFPAFNSQLATPRNNTKLKLVFTSTPSQLVLAFGTNNSHLSSQFVRLAISHAIPRDLIMTEIDSENAIANEILGIPHTNPFYPLENEWETIGPSNQFNASDVDLSGHITFDLEKAWTLMELAGYNMEDFRKAYQSSSGTITKDNSIPAWPLLFAFANLYLLRLFLRRDRKSHRLNRMDSVMVQKT